MDQFTDEEIEAAARVIELINRGGDPSTIMRGDAHRSYVRKLFARRAAARKACRSRA